MDNLLEIKKLDQSNWEHRWDNIVDNLWMEIWRVLVNLNGMMEKFILDNFITTNYMEKEI